MKFLAEIKNQVLTIFNDDGYRHHLNSLDGKIIIEIRKADDKRTIQQNAYLWMYYQIIAEETGHTTEEIHEFCKAKLLPIDFKTIMEEEILIVKSTTKLTKKEFGDYISRIAVLTDVPNPSTGLYNL